MVIFSPVLYVKKPHIMHFKPVCRQALGSAVPTKNLHRCQTP